MLKEPETEKLIAQLFDNQPDSVVWYRPIFDSLLPSTSIADFEVHYANNAAGRLLGTMSAEVLGTQLRTTPLLDEATISVIFTQCLDVWNSGEPIEYTYYNAGFHRYFNVQRSKVEGGILSITRDRTKEVQAGIEQQQQERMYQQILDTAADGIMLLKAVRNGDKEITDFRVAHCNRKGFENGKLPPDAVGLTLLELFPHLGSGDQFELHKQVVETGEPIRFETSFRTTTGTEFGWFIVSLTKLDDGVISNFVDVTDKKNQEQETIKQKNLLNNILDASLNAIYTCDAVRDDNEKIVDLKFVQVNQRFKELSVRPGLNVVGKNLLEEFPATRETETMEQLVQVIETGVPARFEVHYHSDTYDGWYDTSAAKVGKNGVVVSFANVTELKQTIRELQQQKTLLDKILQHSANGISVTEMVRDANGEVIDAITLMANDSAVSNTGLSREVYLSTKATEIDPNIMNSPYGQMCLKTLSTGEPAFIQYLLEFTGRWLELTISKMDDDHLIHIFTDVTAVKEAQVKQQQLLEKLKQSNESLEVFTSAASHDLKEPIRKVRFFIDRLMGQLEGRLSEEESQLFGKVVAATVRMKLLVDDLLEYSHVYNSQQELEEVDLNRKVQLILTDLELMVTEKNAVVNVSDLPSVKGYRRQLQQLFQNLISNALKYNKPGVPPIVHIRSKLVKGSEGGLDVSSPDKDTMFYQIEVQDNGIGFEQHNADRIFNIFTRLHGNSEYAGTGVGLAIVKKVVEKHKGYISAHSEPGKGAIFSVLLPA
ncbi:MAG: domain S-box protein [Flavisolibacter sp.]|jgi:signal transduction histidine kinase|nr:domain S-box protein [Flavisolibacter sp.]